MNLYTAFKHIRSNRARENDAAKRVQAEARKEGQMLSLQQARAVVREREEIQKKLEAALPPGLLVKKDPVQVQGADGKEGKFIVRKKRQSPLDGPTRGAVVNPAPASTTITRMQLVESGIVVEYDIPATYVGPA